MTPAIAPAEDWAPEGAPARRGFRRAGHMRRYTEIVSILVKHGFVDVVDALHLRAYLKAGRRVLSALGHDAHPEPSRAIRLRLAFEELGPTFIKFGQALSTRSDLLPSEALIEQKHSPAALALRTANASREVLTALRTLPANLAEIARKIRSDGVQVQFVHRNLDFFVREMDRSSNRLSFAVVIAAIVIGSSIIVHAAAGPQWLGYPLLGLAGFIAAGVLGIGLAVGILRSGRL